MRGCTRAGARVCECSPAGCVGVSVLVTICSQHPDVQSSKSLNDLKTNTRKRVMKREAGIRFYGAAFIQMFLFDSSRERS